MNSVVLRKSGGFYICFDDDAIVLSYLCNYIVLSYLCNYKINNGKVGFPLNTINKVINILENNSVSYIVKENMEDVNKKMYGNKNKYKCYLEKGKKKIDLDYRISKIINKVNNMTEEEVSKLLDLIEENV